MTYCLGWKTEKGVILAADAVITSKLLPISSESTSFHEPHFLLPDGRMVGERSLKTYAIGSNLILTYTGSVNVMDDFVRSVRKAIDEGKSPLESIKLGLGLNVHPSNPRIGIIFAFRENDDTHLMSFNITKRADFDEHEYLVQGGSIPDPVKSLTENFLLECNDPTDTLNHKFSKLLGVLQAYVVSGPLIFTGAGGSFSALGINQDGIHLQPDVLYLLCGADKRREINVGIFARHGCIIAKPNDKPFLCLMNKESERDDRNTLLARGEMACEAARIRLESGKFSFAIFHNFDHRTVAIVEMMGKKKHNLLWIEPIVSVTRHGLATLIHPKLKSMIYAIPRAGVGAPVFFLPYEIPANDCPIINVHKKYKEEQR